MARHRKFNDHPFAYHAEIELEITTLTNLGVGLGRVPLPASPRSPTPGGASPNTKTEAAGEAAETVPAGGWVVMVPSALAGERVRVRVFRNHKNYSEADLVAVVRPSPHRVAPQCSLFGSCGGCQYQNLGYPEQLRWKQQHVAELLRHLARLEFPVNPVTPSPREYGYRSKITPHFNAPGRNTAFAAASDDGTGGEPDDADSDLPAAESDRGSEPASPPHPAPPAGSTSLPLGGPSAGADSAASAIRHPRSAIPAPAFPIGFLKQGTRFNLLDVPRCPIATDAINERLTGVRAEVHAKAAAGGYQRGATLLLRHSLEGVTTDYEATITEEVEGVRLRFLARDFFQNNPFILPAFTGYVREQAAAGGARFLVDAYCGSGLFGLTAARKFERVTGIEISESSVRWARENAAANGITNATFQVGDAAAIFAGLDFDPAETAVVIDPPRRGCDEPFLRQLLAFAPRTVVYVSCDPATQMRDLTVLLPGGYELAAVQPFDLFPQTRHLECVITLKKKAPAGA